MTPYPPVTCRICGKVVPFSRSRLFWVGDVAGTSGTIRTCLKGITRQHPWITKPPEAQTDAEAEALEMAGFCPLCGADAKVHAIGCADRPA